ncbi:helix-turn-helix transcriptional regulator [Paenalkalicoccus suaedae]|uniref:Helix-turn-helix transcriptional regulator n=1 Tax=Paenalkalicoccus suaedae TaxID=2592382 RepID=A0A859FJS9_9BACI|nr:AraC family transcriptional regulator [Paenalkalicoccus suaedae]QKS73054.1 helix-turn-helix transcriptional regulator [Paenalkalicoccus suaedae]
MVFFEHHGMEKQESFRAFTMTTQRFPLHFHRAYELLFVHDGELQVTIDQTVYDLNKHDMAFIFPNQVHELKAKDGSNISIVLFSPELIGRFFMDYKGFVPTNNVIHLGETPNVEGLTSIYRQKSFLYDVCGRLVDHTDFRPIEHSTKTEAFHQILLYVDAHFGEDCTLKAVAKDVQYDYAYLSKLFIHMTNMSFTEYVNHYRVSQACYMLKNSQRSIGEIAISCGYTNLRSFNRNFKRIVGDSPKVFRELGGGGDEGGGNRAS